MLVDHYFARLDNLIESCSSIRTTIIHKDKRAPYIGHFRADLYFYNDSRLHVREFVFTLPAIIKDAYVYHYQNATGQVIFRYDNTHHFPELPNFPHHKHTPEGVLSSSEPDLQFVLDEIQYML